MIKNIFLILLVNLFCIATFAQSDWRWISPNPPNLKPYSSVTIGNKVFFWCEYLKIMKMDIPTEEFKVIPVYPTNQYIGIDEFAQQGIGFADSLIGYITGSSYGEFRTTNGGIHWIKKAEAGSNIHLVFFASNRRGWKVGVGGLYVTNDAGANWSYISAPPLFGAGRFSKIFALNENHVFILKSSSYNGLGASIYRSLNGGYNWTTINTGIQSDSLNQVKYSDLKINASGIGFATGSIYHPANGTYEGFILKTTDTGNTWSIIKFPNELYKDILLINDNECVLLGNENFYPNVKVVQRKTTDQGISWSVSVPLQTPQSYSYYYNGIYTTNTDAIYMISTAGIYKSTNRGNSYSKLTSETDVLISEIAFDSKPKFIDKQLSIAWLKWNKKPYLISFDSGRTWKQKSLPQSMGYIWLIGIAEEVIYLIADQLRLYKSTDFGETWKQLFVPVSSGLQALDVYSKDIFTLKAYRYLVSSTDGGTTWLKGPDLTNLWLEQTDIIDSGTIVGIGSYFDTSSTKGAFYRTTDFGFSWHIFDTEYEMKQLAMVTSNTGFAIDQRHFYKTTNSGISWTVLRANGNFNVFAFKDSVTGFLSLSNGLHGTNNGGVSWFDANLNIPIFAISRMKYNARNDLFVVGNGALIMSPSLQNNSVESLINYDNINSGFQLSQNYPNPFNPSTRIQYQVSSSSYVTLKVYDVLGNEVATLVDEYKEAGRYEVEFSARGGQAVGSLPNRQAGQQLASGVYFYQLRAGDLVQSKKMLLLR